MNKLSFKSIGFIAAALTLLYPVAGRAVITKGHLLPLARRAPDRPVQRSANFIPLGVYCTATSFPDAKSPTERWQKVDAALAGMASHHINAIWSVNENTEWVAELARHAAVHGIYLVAATNELEGKLPWVRNGNHTILIAKTREIWGNAPAPIAWGLGDEPPINILPEMTNYVADWSKYAPGEPTTTVEPWTNIDQASKLPFTIFTSDVYSFVSPGNPLGFGVGSHYWLPWLENTQRVVDASPRPWMMGQACQEPFGPYTFDAQGNLVYLPGSTVHYVMPTPAQIKWQAWSAFALGAKGMFYYNYADSDQPKPQAKIPVQFSKVVFPSITQAATNSHSPLGLVYHDGRTTPQYEALGRVFGQIASLSPILAQLKPVIPAVNWLSSSPLGGTVATALVNPSTGKRYLVVVAPYTGSDPQTVRVSFGTEIVGLRNVLTGRKIPVSHVAGQNLSAVSLSPGEGALFECLGNR